MHFVYVLKSLKQRNLYIGYTTNIKKRISEHNRGKNLSTKAYVPWKLIFIEGYCKEKDARRREKYLKTNSGSRIIKMMLREFFRENK